MYMYFKTINIQAKDITYLFGMVLFIDELCTFTMRYSWALSQTTTDAQTFHYVTVVAITQLSSRTGSVTFTTLMYVAY